MHGNRTLDPLTSLSNDEMSSNMVVVDVVITTFNETTRLFRAVSSVKNQTSPINKIWIVDDGSENQLASQISATYTGDPQVELVFLRHSGIPGNARKIGVSKSSASWIAFLDADDYWHESKIEQQLLVATKHDAKFVYTNAVKVGLGESSLYFPTDNFMFKILPHQIIKENYVINSSVLVKREVLLEVDMYADLANVRAVEDYATWLRISLGTALYGIAEPLTFYTVSESSLSRETSVDRRAFALTDFLIWSKSKKTQRLGNKINHLVYRFRVLLQLCKEKLL